MTDTTLPRIIIQEDIPGALNINEIGVNVDGDGEYVGLWLSPDRVDADENVYVTVTVEELRWLLVQAEALTA